MSGIVELLNSAKDGNDGLNLTVADCHEAAAEIARLTDLLKASGKAGHELATQLLERDEQLATSHALLGEQMAQAALRAGCAQKRVA